MQYMFTKNLLLNFMRLGTRLMPCRKHCICMSRKSPPIEHSYVYNCFSAKVMTKQSTTHTLLMHMCTFPKCTQTVLNIFTKNFPILADVRRPSWHFWWKSEILVSPSILTVCKQYAKAVPEMSQKEHTYHFSAQYMWLFGYVWRC